MHHLIPLSRAMASTIFMYDDFFVGPQHLWLGDEFLTRIFSIFCAELMIHVSTKEMQLIYPLAFTPRDSFSKVGNFMWFPCPFKAFHCCISYRNLSGRVTVLMTARYSRFPIRCHGNFTWAQIRRPILSLSWHGPAGDLSSVGLCGAGTRLHSSLSTMERYPAHCKLHKFCSYLSTVGAALFLRMNNRLISISRWCIHMQSGRNYRKGVEHHRRSSVKKSFKYSCMSVLPGRTWIPC